MKTAGCVLSSFLLFCMACKEQPQSYTISLQKSKAKDQSSGFFP
jgi:hypothetical protein